MWKKRTLMAMLAIILGVTGAQAETASPRPAAPTAIPLLKPPPVKRLHVSDLAGRWYPKEAAELSAMIDRFFVIVGPSTLPVNTAPVRAILVPHAGYAYSGQTAAFAFKALQGRNFKRVVVVGASHRLSYGGLALTDETHFATPLGEIAVDREAVESLAANPLANYIPRAFSGEHAVEIQLPLLQKSLSSSWTLVPILLGRMDQNGYKKAAELLRPLLDHQTLLVISGDFTHYGPNYQFIPFPPDEKVAANIRLLDMEAWERVKQRDLIGLQSHQERHRLNACAFPPLSLFIPLMAKEGRSILMRYETSGGISGDYTNSVSYLASLFTSPDPFYVAPKHGEITSQQLQLLHGLAVKALQSAVRQGANQVRVEEIVAGVELPPLLKESSGAFVTLKKEGALRGGIGAIAAHTPLYQAVVENAVRAALFDHRFQPVTEEELEQLEVQVSVLEAPRVIRSVEEIELGRHGILLSKGEQRAMFMPEIPLEQKWNLEETLNHLAQKAGLAADGWRQGATFQVFTSRSHTAPFKVE